MPGPVHSSSGLQKVLIVEDDHGTRTRIAAALRSANFDPIEANDGEDGLRKLRAAMPVSAIVLDLILPRLNGWEFRERQLRDPELAAIPTVVITIKRLGAHDLYALKMEEAVQKPFDDQRLLDILTRACQPEGANDQTTLYWSKTGHVGCARHAPVRGSREWEAGGWAVITAAANSRIVYRCEQCSPDHSPIDRSRRKSSVSRV